MHTRLLGVSPWLRAGADRCPSSAKEKCAISDTTAQRPSQRRPSVPREKTRVRSGWTRPMRRKHRWSFLQKLKGGRLLSLAVLAVHGLDQRLEVPRRMLFGSEKGVEVRHGVNQDHHHLVSQERIGPVGPDQRQQVSDRFRGELRRVQRDAGENGVDGGEGSMRPPAHAAPEHVHQTGQHSVRPAMHRSIGCLCEQLQADHKVLDRMDQVVRDVLAFDRAAQRGPGVLGGVEKRPRRDTGTAFIGFGKQARQRVDAAVNRRVPVLGRQPFHMGLVLQERSQRLGQILGERLDQRLVFRRQHLSDVVRGRPRPSSS